MALLALVLPPGVSEEVGPNMSSDEVELPKQNLGALF